MAYKRAALRRSIGRQCLRSRTLSPSRITLLAALFAACGEGEVAGPGTHPPRPPEPLKPQNVIVIVADDLRSDALGIEGNPLARTPNLDRLASEGARFSNAFVVSSVCAPSRATIYTGLYPHEHGTIGNATGWSRTPPHIFEAMGTWGYRVGFVGKWHLGRTARKPPWVDRWVSFDGQGVYLNPSFNVDDSVVARSGHMTEILTEYAVDFIRDSTDQPFFLVLSYKAAHAPFIPMAQFEGSLASAHVDIPRTFDESLEDKPAFMLDRETSADRAELEATTRAYYEVVAGIDWSVGQVIAVLRDQRILDSTLVILVGDNGYMLGEHRLLDKRVAYEASVRVPLIIRWPNWFAGGEIAHGIALNLDIATTIKHAVTGSADEFALTLRPAEVSGRSLKEIADRRDGRVAFLYQYFLDQTFPQTPPMRAIRTGRFKYVTYLQQGQIDELYDLDLDPEERVNVIDKFLYQPSLFILRRQLKALREAAGDAG